MANKTAIFCPHPKLKDESSLSAIYCIPKKKRKYE
jgi:hypothetical protein